MRTKLLVILTVLVVTFSMVITVTWAVSAQTSEINEVRTQTVANSLTLRQNLGTDDLGIDPAIDSTPNTPSLFVVNQLFLGLVKADEDTGEMLPELATSWDMSSNATVFTFTLRSDATWTDGNPVTAYDVRYGILRSLAPATNADWEYVLFVIQNAEEYNNGSVTDPNQVGITVLDSTHIRFDLNQSAAYFPGILATSVARPMPSWAITAHPTDWTEPNNIVTNGAYKLTDWTHGTSMTLQKNSSYYDANNVQIEQVLFSMVDETTAWGLYQIGQLDSAIVPQDQWDTANNDPLLQPDLYSAPIFCTYYYGFNTAKEPFDDVQVRKAFIAAVDRQGVIDNATRYAQRPALTLTPPGMFGHVDGEAEGIGVPYNPTQAQQWLTDAGYPNGQGLPPITLMYNTSSGHQAIAEQVQQDWTSNLSVTVTLSDTNWADYLNLLSTDPPQVWRLGWCVDQYDAYNFLYDATTDRARYGGWSNVTYDNLLDQAVQESDSNSRKSFYRQAEEILVETDAVMLPIYYYADGVAAKSYLERTYWDGGLDGRIADWQLNLQYIFLPTILK